MAGTVHVFGQTAETDSINYTKGITTAVALYQQFVDPPTGLYNGRMYVDYAYSIKEGSPFFMDADFNTGSVIYDGVLYENVPLLYDVAAEELVIKDPFEIYKLSLINERVSSFLVLGHKFERLEQNSLNQSVISTGFYDVLYDGNISVYKKEKKRIQEDVSFSEGLKRFIVETNAYYFKKDSVFYEVNNKGSLLSLMQNKRKDIQQFIRKNKLDLRKDKANSFTRVAAYYDSINR